MTVMGVRLSADSDMVLILLIASGEEREDDENGFRGSRAKRTNRE